MKTEHTVPVRLSTTQIRYLDNIARFLEQETGQSVSPNAVMVTLMERGWPTLIEEIRTLRVQGNARTKRFPTLHLA